MCFGFLAISIFCWTKEKAICYIYVKIYPPLYKKQQIKTNKHNIYLRNLRTLFSYEQKLQTSPVILPAMTPNFSVALVESTKTPTSLSRKTRKINYEYVLVILNNILKNIEGDPTITYSAKLWIWG